MTTHRADDEETVRQRADTVMDRDIHVSRAKIRVDFYPEAGELDFSFIAWDHPGAIVLCNEVWSHYDRLHIGSAGADMIALLYDHLKLFPDPFP